MPTLIAQDIVGVQPMTNIFNMVLYKQPAEYVETVPQGFLVLDAMDTVADWIETQSVERWSYGTNSNGLDFGYRRYIIAEELYTWISVKWSK